MKGRDLLRSAFSEVKARPCWWAGAKAVADPTRRERAKNFIIVEYCIKIVRRFLL